MYRSYACAANRTRGPSVCKNSQSIAEPKLVSAIAQTIRVTADDLFEEIERGYREE